MSGMGELSVGLVVGLRAASGAGIAGVGTRPGMAGVGDLCMVQAWLAVLSLFFHRTTVPRARVSAPQLGVCVLGLSVGCFLGGGGLGLPVRLGWCVLRGGAGSGRGGVGWEGGARDCNGAATRNPKTSLVCPTIQDSIFTALSTSLGIGLEAGLVIVLLVSRLDRGSRGPCA